MAMVIAKKDESFDSLYKRFKKKLVKDNILNDLKKHEYYVSKGEKRRLKHEAAIKKMLKKKRKAERMY